MPSYTAIPNSDIDASSPVTESLLTLMRDNPIAIAENAANSTDIVGLDPLSKIVLSNDAIAVFNNTVITSAHDHYIFEFIDVVPVTDGVRFEAQFSVDNGSNYLTSVYKHTAADQTAFRLNGNAGILTGSASGEGLSGFCDLYSPSSTTQRKRIKASIINTVNDGSNTGTNQQAEHTSLAAINTIKFFFSSGNLNTGIIRCYGRRL